MTDHDERANQENQENRARIKACADYLKKHETSRILKSMRSKYCSYGEAKGHITLTNPTAGERAFLQGLLKKNHPQAKSLRVSLKQFEAAFAGTIFGGVTLEGLLETYFEEALISKWEAVDRLKQDKDLLYQSIQSQICDEALIKWFRQGLFDVNHSAYKLINSLRNSVSIQTLLLELSAVIDCLAQHEEGISLPMLSGLATGNPHALDRNMPLRKMLVYYYSDRLSLSPPHTTQGVQTLFERMTLYVDEIPRTLLTYGIEAYGADALAFGWLNFYLRREPLTLATLNTKQIKRLEAISTDIRLYENPSAFYRGIRVTPEKAAVCLSGQPHLMAYTFLEYLANAHNLAYSGDFDPEGLLIASRLKIRFPKLDLSFFSAAHYQHSLSNEIISERRLKQLNQLTDPLLKLIADEMKTVKCAGYEERVWGNK